MLLSSVPSLVNGLATLSGSFDELLRLVLDFSVQPVEDWDDGAFELFRSIIVGV